MLQLMLISTILKQHRWVFLLQIQIEALPSNNPENKVSKWTNKPSVFLKIKFTGTPELKIQMNNMQPINFFKLFLTDDLINMMVTETN